MIRSTMDALPVPICDGSRLADDRAATEGFLLDLPTICEHYLFGSEDFLGGLLALMQPRPNTLQLPRFALYPLIRGVIESSGQTAWVLGPAADQSARFRRLLQLQMDELRHDRKYIKAHTHPRDDDPPEIRSFTNKMRRTEVGKLDIRRKGLRRRGRTPKYRAGRDRRRGVRGLRSLDPRNRGRASRRHPLAWQAGCWHLDVHQRAFAPINVAGVVGVNPRTRRSRTR